MNIQDLMQQTKSDLSIFWKQRFAIHGHTGWTDRFIFEFDQQCRLLVFSSWLAANLPIAGKALDFGCGTGDFSRFLIGLGWSVMGYDKYIKPDFKHPRFEFSNPNEKLHLLLNIKASSSKDIDDNN